VLAALFPNNPKDEKLMIVRMKSELDKVEKVQIIIVPHCKIHLQVTLIDKISVRPLSRNVQEKGMTFMRWYIDDRRTFVLPDV
jgi:hypothetical protein